MGYIFKNKQFLCQNFPNEESYIFDYVYEEALATHVRNYFNLLPITNSGLHNHIKQFDVGILKKNC